MNNKMPGPIEASFKVGVSKLTFLPFFLQGSTARACQAGNDCSYFMSYPSENSVMWEPHKGRGPGWMNGRERESVMSGVLCLGTSLFYIPRTTSRCPAWSLWWFCYLLLVNCVHHTMFFYMWCALYHTRHIFSTILHDQGGYNVLIYSFNKDLLCAYSVPCTETTVVSKTKSLPSQRTLWGRTVIQWVISSNHDLGYAGGSA